jgi:hypothetical protein
MHHAFTQAAWSGRWRPSSNAPHEPIMDVWLMRPLSTLETVQLGHVIRELVDSNASVFQLYEWFIECTVCLREHGCQTFTLYLEYKKVRPQGKILTFSVKPSLVEPRQSSYGHLLIRCVQNLTTHSSVKNEVELTSQCIMFSLGQRFLTIDEVVDVRKWALCDATSIDSQHLRLHNLATW